MSWTSSKFDQIRLWTAELAALEHLEKSPKTYNGRSLVNTLVPAFLMGSSSFLQLSRTCMHESLDEFEFHLICNRVTAVD